MRLAADAARNRCPPSPRSPGASQFNGIQIPIGRWGQWGPVGASTLKVRQAWGFGFPVVFSVFPIRGPVRMKKQRNSHFA